MEIVHGPKLGIDLPYSVPIMASNLYNLSCILTKTEKWADENQIEHSKLIEGKLAPDMLPFKVQIYICTNACKFLLSRVLGQEVPVWEDNEATFADLRARIEKAQALLKTVDEQAFEGKNNSPVNFTASKVELKMTGMTYTQYFALPNFFFHVTTAYNILRQAGAPLGKQDFIAGDRQSVP
ncbi:hypothetical protein AMS68_001486 [Peltaster fructicola]|uniref:DUF1993 domain-containing protein n=1 Tax=Peltaster fructicola TaxID=286661 RepID=A0A6H0XMX0_9PEZI|nr:hypothetical protein AMS68_001486 [Peltaster fructicola]